jgi:hypothetical protein
VASIDTVDTKNPATRYALRGIDLHQAGDGVELRPLRGFARLRLDPRRSAWEPAPRAPTSASERCLGCSPLMGARQHSWAMHYFLHYLVPGDAVAPSSVRWRTESGLFVIYLSGRSHPSETDYPNGDQDEGNSKESVTQSFCGNGPFRKARGD